MDQLIILIVALFLIAVVLAAFVLPLVSIILSARARNRVAELTSRVKQLEALMASQPRETPTTEAPKPEPTPPPPSEPPPPPTPEPIPPPVYTPPPVATYTRTSGEIESMIGRRWIGWIAVSLLLFATAFFLKYAFDNRWIGELGRVAIGIAFGCGMCLAGFRYYQRGWRNFSQILTGGGIVLLYLSNYAAFGYYHLVGQKMAFAYLLVLVAEAAVLALVYNAPAIAIMALIGGFLTPMLLHSDRDQYRSFFTYLIALDAGALALLKHWRGLSSVAYAGTQLLFWMWYNENYHHQKRAAVLVFQTALFLLFLLAHLGRELIRRESATAEDLALLLINPFVFFATAYHLLNPTYHDWMGVFAIVMALLYAGAAKILLMRSVGTRREVLPLIAVALAFVSIAIPIQLRSNWITIGWAVEGVAILWAGLEIRSSRLRAHALTLLGLALGKLLFWDTPYAFRPLFIPIFNRYFLSSLLVIACLAGGAFLYQRTTKLTVSEARAARLTLMLAAAVALWFVMSIETHTFFDARAASQRTAADAEHERWLGQMALSVLWAAYAATLAAAGFIRRSASLRWASLALFALTVIKAMLIDIAQLQQLYRIVVFFVLGVLLLLVAWAYHKAFHFQESTK